MNKKYQYEVNETCDIVLYYKSKISTPPVEPIFETIRKLNQSSNMDDLLDIFSNLKKKYQKDLLEYNNSNDVISSFIFFPFDDKFIENVKNFEKKIIFHRME